MKPYCAALLFLISIQAVSAQVAIPVIDLTNIWRYEASGADLGTAWRATNFDDSAWPAGRALLALEDNPAVSPINTVLPILGTTGAVLTTHYFRTSFVYTNDLPAPMLLISNLVDDGAVFYLNGIETARLRMPGGIITNRTSATSSASEGVYNVTTVRATNLWEGTNWFAVEVHQRLMGSGDVVFGMALLVTKGTPEASITPSDPVVPVGAPFALIGTATGLSPYSYQWFHDNIPILGATNRRLFVYRSELTDAGNYRLAVTNEVGSTSSSVNVTITNAPSGPGAQNTSYQGELTGASGAGGFVRGAAALTNGFLIGGQFEGVNMTNSPGIARLDSIGNVDPTFVGHLAVGPFQFGPTVYAVCPDGNHIYIGGRFNGPARTNLARLNWDGSLDATFAPTIPPNGLVRLIAPLTNGGVIVAGEFTTINGASRGRVARLNANGSLDESYGQGLGANGTIRAMLPLSDGKLLIGGFFTTFDGIAQIGLARLNKDGSLDPTFLMHSNAAVGGVYYLGFSDNQIIVGGDFTMLGGTPAGRLARINPDGMVNTNFNIGSGFTGGPVYTVTEQYNGKLVVGGFFTNFNGEYANYLTRLHATGVRDFSFQTGAGPDWPVLITTLAPAGDLLVCGLFSYYNDVLANRTLLVFGDGGPSLEIIRAPAGTIICWPEKARNFGLRQSTSIFGPWSDSLGTPAYYNGRMILTNTTSQDSMFFRLYHP